MQAWHKVIAVLDADHLAAAGSSGYQSQAKVLHNTLKLQNVRIMDIYERQTGHVEPMPELSSCRSV